MNNHKELHINTNKYYTAGIHVVYGTAIGIVKLDVPKNNGKRFHATLPITIVSGMGFVF